MEHRCLSNVPDCSPAALCPGCYNTALLSARGQAGVIGQCWAERVARRPEHRSRERWPDDDKARAIAARLVEHLVTDPRLRAELAPIAIAAATAWWERRPASYR